MIENYGIFYSYKTARNILTIRFNDLKINKDIRKGNVFCFYHDDVLVSYVIDGIDKVMKIHAEGLIPAPNNMMIDLVNVFLKKEKLEQLLIDNKGNLGSFYSATGVDAKIAQAFRGANALTYKGTVGR